MDPKSTRLLRDLRAALLKAMTESREMRQALDRLRASGWSAYVVIDEAPDEAEIDATAIVPVDRGAADDWSGDDLSFLRALGIDPEPEPRGA